jgi:hypothetical protein
MKLVGILERWSIPLVLLVKVPEHVYDCHCHSNCSSLVFCGLVLSFLYSWVFFFSCLPLCYQIWHIQDLIIGSPVTFFQVDSNFKYWDIISTCEHNFENFLNVYHYHYLYGDSSPLFMMKVMVWHFVSDSHKVMASLILVVLFSSCCFGL